MCFSVLSISNPIFLLINVCDKIDEKAQTVKCQDFYYPKMSVKSFAIIFVTILINSSKSIVPSLLPSAASKSLSMKSSDNALQKLNPKFNSKVKSTTRFVSRIYFDNEVSWKNKIPVKNSLCPFWSFQFANACCCAAGWCNACCCWSIWSTDCWGAAGRKCA